MFWYSSQKYLPLYESHHQILTSTKIPTTKKREQNLWIWIEKETKMKNLPLNKLRCSFRIPINQPTNQLKKTKKNIEKLSTIFFAASFPFQNVKYMPTSPTKKEIVAEKMNATRWKLRQQLCRQTIINENPSVKSIISSSFRRNDSPSLCCFIVIIIASTTTVKIQKEEVKLQIKTINVKHISKSKQRCKFPRQLNRRQTDGPENHQEKKGPELWKNAKQFQIALPFLRGTSEYENIIPKPKNRMKVPGKETQNTERQMLITTPVMEPSENGKISTIELNHNGREVRKFQTWRSFNKKLSLKT